MKGTIFKHIFFLCSVFFATSFFVYAGTLTCTATTSAACTGVVMLRMNAGTNAHAELPSQSTASYNGNVICCSGVVGLSNTCSGTQVTILKLASTTNSHVQENTFGTYTNNACMSVGAGGYAEVFYKTGACSGDDTTMLSISSADNSHVGTSTEYSTKVCASASATAKPQVISFSLSTNTAYFGGLSTVSARYASSTNTNGDGIEVEAHTMSVSTNAVSGYNVIVRGQTLTYGTRTIAAIGAVNTAPAIGVEQFGLRVATSSGNGTVSSPYNGTGFAYAASATTSSQIGTGPGDNGTTVYSFRYVANTATLTAGGQYTVNLVYVATANF